MKESTLEKLTILASSAKYDVSCASSGSNRSNTGNGLGTSVACGICHSFTEDGRCIALLKIMLTNHCINDCAYCVSRRSNDIRRATFTPDEIVELTIEFYRRNYIEGLFLSSGIIKNADYTMGQMAKIAKDLRKIHRYNGYIHLKAIPGASQELIKEAGLYADRLSVNIEISNEQNLKYLAPEKDYASVLSPMNIIKDEIAIYKEEKSKYRYAQRFTPGGQSTQLIIGATKENDKEILNLSSNLYSDQQLKRVYYSGYIPINSSDSRLPMLPEPPLKRENRLYQADWLLRFYSFTVDEIVNDNHPDLDLEIDPKLAYALRNPAIFPIDLNKADYETILRVPGIGVRSAKLIIASRRYGSLSFEHLKKIGVVLKRAKYFITSKELKEPTIIELGSPAVRRQILSLDKPLRKLKSNNQLSLFTDLHFA